MKRIVSLAVCAALLLCGCAASLPVTLDAAEIARIDCGAVLMAGVDDDAIREFADTYNESRRYTDDAGTTHPYMALVTFTDGSKMRIWAGTQDFLTVERGDMQFNLKNPGLEALIADMGGVQQTEP